jgi:hypothetical protein
MLHLLARGVPDARSYIDMAEREIARLRAQFVVVFSRHQLARFHKFSDSLLYLCGAKATTDLYQHVKARVVSARESALTDTCAQSQPAPSTISILANGLLVEGLALDWPKYSSGKYHKAQVGAQQRNEGLWAGSYVAPWIFRLCMKSGGT